MLQCNCFGILPFVDSNNDVIIIHIITLMPGIYKHIHETTHISTVYSVVAVLYLQSVLHVMY
jgi:hypothetical protein